MKEEWLSVLMRPFLRSHQLLSPAIYHVQVMLALDVEILRNNHLVVKLTG